MAATSSGASSSGCPPTRASAAGSFDFGEPIGRQRMIRYPAGEQITVPRHIPTRRVRTAISAASTHRVRRLAARCCRC